MTVKDLTERMSYFRSKISIKLTGADKNTGWESAIRRKVRGLGATAALEGRRKVIKNRRL
jgi:hypothetical protein